MSTPGGPDDDVDDVTLWAGRLRAWPVVPTLDEGDDATVRSARSTPVADDEASEEVIDPVDDTILLRPAARRSEARPTSTADPAPERDAPERDVPERDAPERDAPERDAPDEDTAPSRSTGTRAERRAREADAIDAFSEAAGTDTVAHAVEVDDTTAGSRPRAGEPAPPRIDDASGAVREARSPDALGREAYAPRADAPVRVARRAADPRPSTTDAAAAHPRRTRGGARLLILLAVMVAVVAVAAVGVALLLG
nr:hypothetical protein [Microbacterium testaceum]